MSAALLDTDTPPWDDRLLQICAATEPDMSEEWA